MLIDIPMSCLKTALLIAKKHLLIGKSLFSKVPSSNSLRSPTARCFRKANAFSDFRFEDKINPSSAGKIEKLNF